jgi:hypothetical protein
MTTVTGCRRSSTRSASAPPERPADRTLDLPRRNWPRAALATDVVGGRDGDRWRCRAGPEQWRVA